MSFPPYIRGFIFALQLVVNTRWRVARHTAVVLTLSGCMRLGYDLSATDSERPTNHTGGAGGQPTVPSQGGGGSTGGAAQSGGDGGTATDAGAGGNNAAGAAGNGSALEADLCDAQTHHRYWIHSNVQGDHTPALYAVDGDLQTTYQTAAEQTDLNQAFLQLDFHGRVSLDGLTIAYPGYVYDYPRGYEIYVSDAPEPLATDRVAQGITTPPSTIDPYVRFDFPSATGRYLRLVQTGTSVYWWSVPELSLTNCRVVSVAHAAPTGTDVRDRTAWRVTTSSLVDPLPMLDGNAETYWQTRTSPRDGFWIEADLSTVGAVNGLVLTHNPGEFPVMLQVATSTDGFAFTPIGPPIAGSDVMSISFTANARYLRLVHVGSRDATWWSIAELDLLP